MLELQQHEQGVLLPVRARAGGRINGITGVRQGALMVSVVQVPEKGKANQAITAVLAKLLGCSKSEVQLLRGGESRDKQFLLVGQQLEQVRTTVEQALDR